MRNLPVTVLSLIFCCLSTNIALADICTYVVQKTGLDLNEAECYVLKQLDKGKIAHFRKTSHLKKGEILSIEQLLKAKFQDRFSKIENRTLRADFLEKLLTGALPSLAVTEKGVRTFSGEASFYGATFSEEASFVVAKFSEGTFFNGATFSGEALFWGAIFSGEASFYEVRFLKEANFTSCDFKSKSNFINTFFHDTVIFDAVSGFSKMDIIWEHSPHKFGNFDKFGDLINNINKQRELKNHLNYNESFYIGIN